MVGEKRWGSIKKTNMVILKKVVCQWNGKMDWMKESGEDGRMFWEVHKRKWIDFNSSSFKCLTFAVEKLHVIILNSF